MARGRSTLLRRAVLDGWKLTTLWVATAWTARAEAAAWLPSEPLAGRIVFEQKHCSACHSISGTGGNIGPDLAEETFTGTFLDLASSLWNHIPDMVVEQKSLNLDWPRFTDEEVTSLISYLYYLRYLGTPGDISKGERLFAAKGCQICHAIGEKKGGDVGPKLDRLTKYASPIFMVQALWNHGPQMQQQIRAYGVERPELGGQDIADLSAYIRSVSQWNVREKVYLSPGDPNRGRDIFRDKDCHRCHAVGDQGGEIGPALDDLDLSQAVTEIAAMMWNHADEMQTAMGQEHVEWPTFEKGEMADLIAYLYFINFVDPPGDVERGRDVFQDKECASCHSIRGVGGSVGPDLADTTELTSRVSILRTMFNHADRMSETVLSEGKRWPILSGPQLRDVFAYLQSVHETGED